MEAGENPQWLYTVVFDGRELWGADADPTVKVSIDAFEPYLERGVMDQRSRCAGDDGRARHSARR